MCLDKFLDSKLFQFLKFKKFYFNPKISENIYKLIISVYMSLESLCNVYVVNGVYYGVKKFILHSITVAGIK